MTHPPDIAGDDGPVHLLGALALEVTPGAGHVALAQADAATMGGHVATDLAAFAADAALLELVTVGAHYDPVELLRPGWPLHRELEQLAARAPRTGGGAGGRVIAFGAHDGKLPGTLAPSPDFAGGPLRLVPFLLSVGDTGGGAIARLGDRFERELLERGMAGAATALFAQERFGLRVEHARYLTLHDLVAMTALQYEHAGLAPLWPLLETALLAPAGDCLLDEAPEPRVACAGGEARITLFDARDWCRRQAPDADCDDPATRERLATAMRHFEARQRQFAEVLMAHAIPVTLEHHPQLQGL